MTAKTRNRPKSIFTCPPSSLASYTSKQTHRIRPPSGGNNPTSSAYLVSYLLGMPTNAAAPRQSAPQSGTEVSRTPQKVTIDTREASESRPTRSQKMRRINFHQGNAMPCPRGGEKDKKTASNCRLSRLRELTRPSTPSTSSPLSSRSCRTCSSLSTSTVPMGGL